MASCKSHPLIIEEDMQVGHACASTCGVYMHVNYISFVVSGVIDEQAKPLNVPAAVATFVCISVCMLAFS